jgi:lipopolysaccharide export system permease protein
MKLIERYIFKRLVGIFLLTLLSLATMVWLALALGQFDLVTDKGQSIGVFFSVTLLLIPALVVVVCPIALLIAVITTLNALNNDAELVVINASGASQMALVRPVVIMGLLVTLGMASTTLYFGPLALNHWRTLITEVRSSILSSIVHEGAFMKVADGFTFHVRDRRVDGTMEGIFMFDDREADVSVTYLAERGTVIESPLGEFLIMNNGTIQRRSKTDSSISIIEFTSYAIDLSSFSSPAVDATIKPTDRSTLFLLNPDPQDRYYQQYPDQYRTELHSRLSIPFYALIFAVLPLLFLAQAESTRQSRAVSITLATWSAIVLRGVGFLLPALATSHPWTTPLLYVFPLGATLAVLVVVLLGIQLRPPEHLVALTEATFGRLGGAASRPTSANG